MRHGLWLVVDPGEAPGLRLVEGEFAEAWRQARETAARNRTSNGLHLAGLRYVVRDGELDAEGLAAEATADALAAKWHWDLLLHKNGAVPGVRWRDEVITYNSTTRYAEDWLPLRGACPWAPRQAQTKRLDTAVRRFLSFHLGAP